MDDKKKQEQKQQQSFNDLKGAFKNFTAATFIFMCVVCLTCSLFGRGASNFLNSLMAACLFTALVATALMGYSNKLSMRGSKRSGLAIATIAGLIIIAAGAVFTVLAKNLS